MKNYKISDILCQDAVIQAVKLFGIEATEEKIKKLYSNTPMLRDSLLKAWKQIYIKGDLK